MPSSTTTLLLVVLSLLTSIVKASIPVSGVANTTQNWNCCKPSCGWPGKADVNSPVQSCDINNHPLANYSVVSSCQDGPSYMCADQAPWLVNEQMAYGFAAVSIDGGSEASWCCACFELAFTSGSVLGKKMIVQATDTQFGAPPGSHFVLAVGLQWDCAYH